jgi:hypothetical protein
MRLRRDPGGRLGEPVERGIPVIPERYRLAALVGTVTLCVAILLLAVILGLRSG